MPIACMNAYAVVGPTNLKPRVLLLGHLRRLRSRGLELGRGLVGFEAPEEGPERPEFADELDRPIGVADRGLDLAPMPDDAGIAQETVDVVITKLGDLFIVEAREGPPELRPFAQDGQPAEARLEPLQAQLLEEQMIVVDRKTPLDVVILEVVRSALPPPAAGNAVLIDLDLSCNHAATLPGRLSTLVAESSLLGRTAVAQDQLHQLFCICGVDAEFLGVLASLVYELDLSIW